MDAVKESKELISKLTKMKRPYQYDQKDLDDIAEVKEELKKWSAREKVAFVLEVINEIDQWRQKGTDSRIRYDGKDGYPFEAVNIISRMFYRNLPFNEREIVYILECTAELSNISTWSIPYIKGLLSCVEKYIEKNDLPDSFREGLTGIQVKIGRYGNAPERRLSNKISVMLQGPRTVPLVSGEAWCDKALEDLNFLSEEKQLGWIELIHHCYESTAGKPSAKWTKKVKELLKKVGKKNFEKYMYSWMPLVDKPRTEVFEEWSEWEPNPNLMICDDNSSVIKGLVWCCGLFKGKEMARCLRDLALSAYKKVPGIGPRAVKIGNACIYSLSAIKGMDGLEQLAFLKVKVRFKTALKLITAALERKAEEVGVTVEELEEMSVPEYGLTEVGVLCEQMGDFIARLEITGTSTTKLGWVKPDGKVQKSVPASVKRDFAEELKDLKASIKDIQKMLPAQRDRIDSMFLHGRSWEYAVWKERYLDHPLVGTLGRRIIWDFCRDGETVSGVYFDGKIVDSDGNDIDGLDGCTAVSLWHPIGKDVDSILAWRGWFETHEIQQPFKQAHREVYLLTDAERNTRVYSNRYAAHIVKQHQFNSLCAVRGWKNTLKLLVDDDFPDPSVTLNKYNIRAEFWTDGAGEEYDVDTNETGTFYYLATDQVRFYDISGEEEGNERGRGWQNENSEPMELERIDPLVFSEVMRDVDLFVGVASIGNDPQWQDGGVEGRYFSYWHNWSFGDLGEAAKTRKEIVERLIPRLKIRDVCSIDGKFLVVKGSMRTYKIHLGSGNILMEPNDQYLCIVQNRGKSAADKIFLPFEGDGVLSVILSKAFMLADDTKIKDETIISQIKSNK